MGFQNFHPEWPGKPEDRTKQVFALLILVTKNCS